MVQLSAQCVEIDVHPDQAIFCPEEEVTLTATEGYNTYHWYYNFSNSNEDGTLYESGDQTLTLNANEWAMAYFYVEVDDPDCTTPSETVVWDGWVFQFPAISHDANTALCPGDTAVIENAFGSPHSIQWFLDGMAIPGATDPTLEVYQPGMYTISVTYDECPEYWVSSGIGPTFTMYTTEAPVITLEDAEEGQVLSIPSGTNPQWFLDGAPIEGANALTYAPEEEGMYTVAVTDANGCLVESGPYEWTLLSASAAERMELVAFPNPFAEALTLEAMGQNWQAIRIFDLSGRVVFAERQARQNRHTYALPHLPRGLYLLEVEAGDGTRSTLKLTRK